MTQLKYHFSWDKAHTQIIQIKFQVSGNTRKQHEIRLPLWRPGRYELGNFAKNIMSIHAHAKNGKALKLVKTSIHSWMLETEGEQEYEISYRYYAAVLNAGSTWLHEDQLYVNPVNCCLYLPERMDEPCALTLDVPNNYQIAIDQKEISPRTYRFSNFDRLADTPFIASPSIQHLEFESSGHLFHLWFQGLKSIQENKLKADFSRFCEEQIRCMGELPGREYHFLFQITPQQSYHGVEHLYSTVIALGPEKDLFGDSLYSELLGVSSHELFHAWNVKWIRPADMLPYHFEKENYSRLGWIYEGVTTWYGDLFLYRSGVFDFKAFKTTFEEKLKKHFNNYGRFNYSVADSSFDTWLDGYVAGAPHRKTSIYTEGSLLTFMLDSRIRAFTNDLKSFDDVLRQLLADARQGLGYTKERLIEIMDSFGPQDHREFLKNYAEGCLDYEPELRKSLQRLGLDIVQNLDLKPVEHAAGLKLSVSGQQAEVLLVAPASPAEKAGMATGDQLIALNGVRWDLALVPDLLPDERLEITAFRNAKIINFNLLIEVDKFFTSRQINLIQDSGEAERKAFHSWSGRDFPQ